MLFRKLERDVYVLQADALSQPVEPNALVIVNEDDVVVAGPGGMAASAEHVIREIRSVTIKPVSVVVNTLRQAGPVTGNRVYGEAYPGVRIIGPLGTRRDEGGALALRRGTREIHVRHLNGDIVVWLPAERILAGGTLVVAPVVSGFSLREQRIATLEGLAAYDFEHLVPGYGEVQTGREGLRQAQQLLREVRQAS